MPKVGMGPVRRKQLVDATISSIHTYGLADTTVTRIARSAGVSPGIVHHYFTDKDDLLFESMRQMLRSLKTEVLKRLEKSNDKAERLNAIIEASFSPEQFSPEVTSAWLALYASSRHSPGLFRILQLYHRRLRSNLLDALGGNNPQNLDKAEAIAALIDGLYLRAALNLDDSDMQQLQQLACKMSAKLAGN